MTALCNLRRVGDRLRNICKQRSHFRRGFQIELVGLEVHMLRVIQAFSRLDAEQYLLHGSIFPADIVGIVGGSQRNPRLTGKPYQLGQIAQFVPDLMILNLQEIVFCAEQGTIPQRRFLGAGIVIPCQFLRHLSGETAGQTN